MAFRSGKHAYEMGILAAKKRWGDYERNLRLKHNHDPLLKSKLCGYLAGDGCLYIHKERARPHLASKKIAFYPDHIDLAEDFVKTFYIVYGVKPYIKRNKNYFRVDICNKLAYLDLTSITNFGTLTWEVPFKLFKKIVGKREWIRAFFDCEAYVGKNVIQVQSVNKKGLEQVRKLLEEFDIPSKIYSYERRQKNWNTNYILCIMKKKYRLNYLNKIGFLHPKKMQNLRRYLNAGVAQFGTAPDI